MILSMEAMSQEATIEKTKFAINGTAGISYEYYGLSKKPVGWTGYSPRKPWNQVRFNFSPNMQFGKDFSMPFNFNFALKPTNYAGPYSNISKQSFSQFITNPMNSFGLNPKYKWAEVQLGTQYLNYSELSTGDIGVFGAGFDLRPGSYIFKFFKCVCTITYSLITYCTICKVHDMKATISCCRSILKAFITIQVIILPCTFQIRIIIV